MTLDLTNKRFALYVPLNEDMEIKKQYLMQKGFNVAVLVRNFIADVYKREKQKETS